MPCHRMDGMATELVAVRQGIIRIRAQIFVRCAHLDSGCSWSSSFRLIWVSIEPSWWT